MDELLGGCDTRQKKKPKNSQTKIHKITFSCSRDSQLLSPLFCAVFFGENLKSCRLWIIPHGQHRGLCFQASSTLFSPSRLGCLHSSLVYNFLTLSRLIVRLIFRCCYEIFATFFAPPPMSHWDGLPGGPLRRQRNVIGGFGKRVEEEIKVIYTSLWCFALFLYIRICSEFRDGTGNCFDATVVFVLSNPTL